MCIRDSADADRVFLQLASQTRAAMPRHLLTAPFQLHRRLLGHLQQVALAAQRGQPARIVVKVNGLTDPALIRALVQASQAGARIDLIVRGACMLPPGLPGSTHNTVSYTHLHLTAVGGHVAHLPGGQPELHGQRQKQGGGESQGQNGSLHGPRV